MCVCVCIDSPSSCAFSDCVRLSFSKFQVGKGEEKENISTRMESGALMRGALNDLQCAEAYYRTVIACDEVRLRTARSSQLHGQPSLLWRDAPMRTWSVPNQITTNDSCNMCCNHREITVGICSHADDALATLRRQQEFMEFYRKIDRRMRSSADRIHRSGSAAWNVRAATDAN